MNPLEQALTEYLSIRRSLGFRLREPEASLRNFVAFLQAEGASYITRELALRWANQPTKVSPFNLGMAFGYGPMLCYLAQCCRASHRNSARRPSPSSLPAQAASHL